MPEAEWLLRNISIIRKRISNLRDTMTCFPQGTVSRAALIEEYMLSRPAPDGMPSSKGSISNRTERVALDLDRLCANRNAEHQASAATLQQELALLIFYESLYACAKAALTLREQEFVELHFEQGNSLSRLASPAFARQSANSVPFTTAALRRMRKNVLAKTYRFLCLHSTWNETL